MADQYPNGSTTLPRDFRFHHAEEGPHTPEPMTAAQEPEPPSPPRQPRFKVRRRNASNLQAPTEQFLASVEAADIPIPSIELPQLITPGDSEMRDVDATEDNITDSVGFLAPEFHNPRSGSPPKTPMPTRPMDDTSTTHRPNWAMGATAWSPDDSLHRPTSSNSNASYFSDDSFYSCSRASRPSEYSTCTSPESDFERPFQFPSTSKGKNKAPYLGEATEFATLNQNLRSKTRADAPWTKAMNTHLWSTYMLYLQDPTVTPFRLGANVVPPEGVCRRVARVAKRSWKGPKLVTAATRRAEKLGYSSPRASDKSGSLTPKGPTSNVFAAWPHSASATRNHLRELCKGKGNSAVRHGRHLQSRSPTPFTKPTSSNFARLCTPEPRTMSSFSTQDISLSLTTSTSKTMQADGPLAQLASGNSAGTTPQGFKPSTYQYPQCLGLDGTQDIVDNVGEASHIRRLGSPFVARTYGPSSSQLHPKDSSSPLPSSGTAGPYLRSPFPFGNTRSLNGTQKRRAQDTLDEEMNPNGAVVRPSILDQQLFGKPFGHSRRVRSRGFSLGDEALRRRAPVSQSSPPPKFNLASNPEPLMTDLGASLQTPTSHLLPPPTVDPPRLGSPFAESGPSQTFPRRVPNDFQATVKRNPYATMHQTRHSIESFDFGEGPSLQSRLEELDKKLKHMQERKQ
ncbi:uncharacterized protein BP5553_10524 [Venustampulla echinocandica]|uniref:Uncharacterized protein n=1 Tax=Venustampulla echinocandica TaxID=2656787 RepID=A0A370T8T6_9HELO|nr:uncharacterized protein BP5553_10524 [Venustampulla echinocandica]RDL29897.1 hypothetical protein BP5553_10524 [Venustampulla echinocandica]